MPLQPWEGETISCPFPLVLLGDPTSSHPRPPALGFPFVSERQKQEGDELGRLVERQRQGLRGEVPGVSVLDIRSVSGIPKATQFYLKHEETGGRLSRLGLFKRDSVQSWEKLPRKEIN